MILVLAAFDPLVGVAIVAAVAGPLVAYLVAAKRFSGRVASSEASDLWAESRSIREWSADRIAALTATISSLETRVESVETQNTTLATENSGLVQQIRDLSDTITELRAEIVALTKELREAHSRVAELEEEVEEDTGG